MLLGTDPQQVAEWRAERRKRWPSRANLEQQAAAKRAKVECDEASAEEIESEDEEEPEDEVEEEDAIVEVTRRPARRGYPEPSFEGLEALRAAPKDYHELAAALGGVCSKKELRRRRRAAADA